MVSLVERCFSEVLLRLRRFLSLARHRGMELLLISNTQDLCETDVLCDISASSLPESIERNSAPHLLEESWHHVLSFLSASDLCTCASWSKSFYSSANNDRLWKQHCDRRWVGKVRMQQDALFWNGDYRHLRLSVPECRSLQRRRGESELGKPLPPRYGLIAGPGYRCGQRNTLLPMAGKWKTCFAHAEIDSKRESISEDEVAHFRWQLIYHGRASTMGMRHFQRDGVFVSPHFGETTWRLTHEGRQFVMQGVTALEVERNADTWGWVMGRGTGTEYHSVELDAGTHQPKEI